MKLLSYIPLVAALAPVLASEPTCNPAVNCPSESMNCMPCIPREDENCTPENLGLYGDGLCAEPHPINKKKKVFGQWYIHRCRQIVDQGWRLVDPQPEGRDYIKACREGEYTCNDGRCEKWKAFPKVCKKNGMVDNPDNLGEPCNIADTDFLATMNALWSAEDHEGYCEGDGIRYYPVRCNRGIGVFAQAACGADQNERPPTCEEQAFPDQLVAPSDACSATCSNQQELEELPGCCVSEDAGSICSNVVVYSPTETIERCDEYAMEVDLCNECQVDGAPGSNEYPYCCRDSGDGNPPSCINVDGFDSNSQQHCVDNQNILIPGDVCYVDTSGSDSSSPPQADDNSIAAGVELSFEMHPASVDSSSDCCCDVVCGCFGDPHCVSFFADYEISTQETGRFTMLEDGAFKVEVESGYPLGVVENVFITMGGNEYLINSEMCVNEGGVYGGHSTSDTVMALDEFDPTFSSRGVTPAGMSADNHLALNPVRISKTYGMHTVSIRCVHFSMRGEHRGFHDRLDVEVQLSTVNLLQEVQDNCCPEGDIVYNHFLDSGMSGFCMRRPQDEGYFIPGAGEDVDPPARRLMGSSVDRTKSMRELQTSAQEAFMGMIQRVEGVNSGSSSRTNVEELTGEELIAAYMRALKLDSKTATADYIDLSEDVLRQMILEANANCYSLASDSVFHPSNYNPCEEGLRLEAKLPSESSWMFVRWFPASLSYCDDKLDLVFKHIPLNDQQFLTNEYELRLSSCTINSQECPSHNFCTPTMSVENLGVSKYLYDSELNRVFEELLEEALTNCECDANAMNCVRLCVGLGICPEGPTCT